MGLPWDFCGHCLCMMCVGSGIENQQLPEEMAVRMTLWGKVTEGKLDLSCNTRVNWKDAGAVKKMIRAVEEELGEENGGTY